MQCTHACACSIAHAHAHTYAPTQGAEEHVFMEHGGAKTRCATTAYATVTYFCGALAER